MFSFFILLGLEEKKNSSDREEKGKKAMENHTKYFMLRDVKKFFKTFSTKIPVYR